VPDAEVLFTGSLNNFTNANLGAVLRWKDTNNWYKAYINGTNLIIQSKVNGTTTTLKSVAFSASAGTTYSIRFRAVGSTLSVRVWQAGTTEPGNWQASVNDSALASGQAGMRIQLASGVTAKITSFGSWHRSGAGYVSARQPVFLGDCFRWTNLGRRCQYADKLFDCLQRRCVCQQHDQQ
jgi:hypothetical protein